MTTKVSDVKKLDPIEHVLLRTDLYLGPTTPATESRKGYVGGSIKDVTGYSAASVRAVQEVFDNSVDAAIRSKFKTGDHITVFLKEDGFKVIDNGTGIPIKKDKELDTWQPELAFANSLAGSNFEGERATSGLFGIGVFAVNVMSKKLELKTFYGRKRYHQVFSDNLSNIGKPKITNSYDGPSGTEVDVTLDIDRLQWNGKDIEVVMQLMNNIMFCYPEITVTCMFGEDEIPLLKGDDFIKGNDIDPICDITNNFCRSVIGSDNKSFVGWVNGTECQGIHIKNFKAALSAKMMDLLSIEGLERGDISRNVGGLLAVRVKDPAFGSATKLEMVDCDKDDLKASLDPLVCKVAAELATNDVFIRKIEAVVEARTHKKIRGKERGKKRVKSEKLIDATAPRAADRTLIITEGDSAKGFFAQARTPRSQAVYCLKGKIKNVIGEDNIIKSADSKALIDLCGVLGLSMTSKDISGCRYQKIYITTDADHDGTSICGLLYGFFWRFWPELLTSGRVCRLMTPRYIIGTKRKFIYQDRDLPKPLPKSIKYIKGLGSLSLKDVKKILAKPVLERVMLDDNSQIFFDLVFGKGSDSADYRKEWLANKEYINTI